MTQVGTLYKLNFPNGKSYIGITTRGIETRFSEHLAEAKSGRALPLMWALRKYGTPEKQILAFMNHDDLPAAEIRAIRVFGTLTPHGYNVTFGGQTSPTLRPEIAAKISASLKGRDAHWLRGDKSPMRRPEVAAKVSAALKGRKAPWCTGDRSAMRRPEVAAKIGAFHRGIPKSAVHRAKLSAATKRQLAERNVWLGRKHSQESIEKMKLAANNRGPEWKRKMSDAVRGFKHTDETRKKMSISHTGKKHSADHIAALRASISRAPSGRFESISVRGAS